MIVMAKPMQLTIVRDEPLEVAAAFCATSVENKGESAITDIPQITRKTINTVGDEYNRNRGERIQQLPEMDNAMDATFFAPILTAMRPLAVQAILPDAMMTKDNSGTLKAAPGWIPL